MQIFKSLKYILAIPALVMLAGCASNIEPDKAAGGEGIVSLIIKVQLDAESQAEGHEELTRGSFDNFDNEQDKWGIPGENMESLRIIIIDGDGVVEHNNLYTPQNATEAGEYDYPVKNNDTKTILLVANEGRYTLDAPGMEIAGGTASASAMFADMRPGTKQDTVAIRKLTLSRFNNSSDGKGLSLKTPLPISAIYRQFMPAGDYTMHRDYMLHRAAVKYSFRIVNESRFKHTLEALRIDRITDREYLFPNAEWKVNQYGHIAVDKYFTPAYAKEQSMDIKLNSPLQLPANMKQAVEALPAPIYVPEGIVGDAPQKMSLALDGQELDIWRDLKWVMPGGDKDSAKPMTDLPRNTHVVVNITIKENSISLVANIQPYAKVDVSPNFGLDRDPDGNIIIKRYPDGSYDVVADEKVQRRDKNGDWIVKTLSDKSIICYEKVYKDYIHDDSEDDYYIYYFEKDRPGGNLVLLRQITNGTGLHDQIDENFIHHDHDLNDKPIFVLDSIGRTLRVIYDSKGNPTTSEFDKYGDKIVQANGFQFQNVGSMSKYLGTYIVMLEDGTEVLRDARDGSDVAWEKEATRSRRRWPQPKLPASFTRKNTLLFTDRKQ